MVTTVTIINTVGYAPLLSWLQENIGNLLHHHAIIFWHGKGWHMKSTYTNGQVIYKVEFDNPEHATWFGLIWL
jgi:hypothetical protein